MGGAALLSILLGRRLDVYVSTVCECMAFMLFLTVCAVVASGAV